MRHYSCDSCGKDLTQDSGLRFYLRIELIARTPAETLEDNGEDSIAAFAESLAEDTQPELELVPAQETLCLDLCSHCRDRFLRDPLGRHGRRVRFSPN